MTKPTTDDRPPYKRVADVLRQEIAAGRLKPGDQMPSYRELQERFEIANMTARSALRVLREDGLIYTVQGRGSFVMDPATTKGGQPAWWTASAAPTKGPSTSEDQAPQDTPLTETLRNVLGQLDELTSEVGQLRHQVSALEGKVEELERQDER
ncbi:GntR family transcriptional regulator [Streptomyces cavernicola]|uniref:GntR family transcriptional regulator n=1 Tax=Streptomyces cavernicola TaxID=3043613 RepID=A0ABT6SKX7_9ACTN|nr:GntR family transcriptional regulator [Streptomyces sp. B-S-A6]MDI3408850.1 GntR family transcriptional regulator [Streptomyces sp. B-S-A6]